VGPFRIYKATTADDNEMQKLEGRATSFITVTNSMWCAKGGKF